MRIYLDHRASRNSERRYLQLPAFPGSVTRATRSEAGFWKPSSERVKAPGEKQSRKGVPSLVRGLTARSDRRLRGGRQSEISVAARAVRSNGLLPRMLPII